MRAVTFTGAGGNEVVRLEKRPDPAPTDDDVIVQVQFAGLNPADIVQRRGHYPAPPGFPADVPGLEVAGRVTQTGAGVDEWSPGDMVFGLVGGGGLAEKVRVHRRHIVRRPEGMSEQNAAATPEAFITAHDAIRTQAALALGETLLVRGANGGVGSAALQIAVAGGATALGVVRSAEGGDLVRSLGAQSLSEDDVLKMEGVADVVLELVSGAHLAVDIRALRHAGRIIVVGVSNAPEATINLRDLMARQGTIRGTTLRGRTLEQKAQTIQAFEHEIVPLLASGRIVPVIDSVYAADDLNRAFDHLEHGPKNGKILLAFS